LAPREGLIGAEAARALRRAAPWVWGGIVATGLCRFFFTYSPGEIHVSADGASYVSRLVEFLSCLRGGYPFPQWAIHFRQGLGSPYFSYYQPGFFYAASLFSVALPPLPAIGMTLWTFSLVGYAGMFWLVRERFGVAAGVLAGSALLLSNYSLIEVYQRGDFSEYAGMMTLPVLLHWLTGWLEHGRPWHWRALGVGCAVLVLLHCVAGLLGYGVLALTTLWYAAATRSWRRALWVVAALVAGAGMAALYWVPLAFEWNLVQGDRAMMTIYKYSRHFVNPLELLTRVRKRGLVPVYLGPVVPALIAAATLFLVVQRRRVTAPQWRLVVAMWALVAIAAFMMGPVSEGVWATAPLLERIQFPWRFLLVLTVATSALAGAVVGWPRIAMVVGLVGLAVITVPRAPIVRPRQLPASAADIARVYFAPDVAGEWLPRGATLLRGHQVPAAPLCEPSSCQVEAFERQPGRLRVRLVTEDGARLVLPHYYFPVGWQARIDGTPVDLAATPEGLMLVRLDRGGLLELTFTMTPMRRLGVLVSAVMFGGWLLTIGLGLPPRTADAQAELDGWAAVRRRRVAAR
jgi:hypothetical protein